MASKTNIYVCKESAAFVYDGDMVVIHKGVTRVRAGHPMVKDHPELFEPITVHYDVEDATARPGEKRGEPSTTAAPRRGRGRPRKVAEPPPVKVADAPAGEPQGLTTADLKPAKD